MYIRVAGNDLVNVKNEVDRIWRKNFSDRAPDFEFLDQHIQALYTSEMKLGAIFATFSGIAIFLCLIGLFGMVYFELQQRTKEIAVRKILGASVKDLLALLNSTFFKIILISNAIAWPIVYYLSAEWLNGFYYRITLTYRPFFISMVICLILTVLTVSLQAIKVIRKTPVDALKYE
ncbi:acidobacterial duplicated orphan permease [compost metagenome]